MKGNINVFSGDKIYQTDRFLRFRLPKIEEAYNHDLYARNQYSLIFLSILALLLLILSYFSNSCGTNNSECTHQSLLILSLLGFFGTIVIVSKGKNPISPYLFSVESLYAWVKICEEFEGRIPVLLITVHLTTLAYFLSSTWLKTLIFQMWSLIILHLYLWSFDYLIYQSLTQNLNFLILNILVSVLLIFLNEKASKEKWVLFDSFKKSERLMEFLIDELCFPVFLVNVRLQIYLHNFQALALMPGGNPNNANSLNGKHSIFRNRKIMGINRNLMEIFPDENSESAVTSLSLINSVLIGGKQTSCGFIKLSVLKETRSNFDDPSQIILEECLFEMACQGFVWKGVKCALIGLKEEKNMQRNQLFSEFMITKSLGKIVDLLRSRTLEEQFYYDSLLQNTTLMESNKAMNYTLYRCQANLFFTLLMKNFLFNNFEKIILEPETQFFQSFQPNELFSTILHILRLKSEKYDSSVDVVPFENDKSFLHLEKKISNFSAGGDSVNGHSVPFKPSSNKNNSSNESDKNPFVYGPGQVIEHILITVLRAVMKSKLCRRFTLSYKIQKEDRNELNRNEFEAFEEKKNEDESMILRIELGCEEISEKKGSISLNSNYLPVGDFLSSTLKEQRRVEEFLNEILKPEKSFLDADRDTSFLYFQNKRPETMAIFFLPYMIKALGGSKKVVRDEEFNKICTKLVLFVPIKLPNNKNQDALPSLSKLARISSIPPIEPQKFNSLEAENLFKRPFSEDQPRKKHILAPCMNVFSLEKRVRNEEKKEESAAFLKQGSSKELLVNELEGMRESSQAFPPSVNKNNSKSEFPRKTLKNFSFREPVDFSCIENLEKKTSPMKKQVISQLKIPKKEVIIEEELKKYLFHMQNGFTATIEHVLNEILNEESAKDAKIIFPPKSQVIEEDGNKIMRNGTIKKERSLGSVGVVIDKKPPLFRNSFMNGSKKKQSEEKDDVSSFIFTESNRTESLLTGKSNEEEILNDSSEINSGSAKLAPKEAPKTQSGQMKPRTILKTEVNNLTVFRSPNLQRDEFQEKHVLVRGESLIKYLRNNSFGQSNNDPNKAEVKDKEKGLKIDIAFLRGEKGQGKSHLNRASDHFKKKETKDIRRLTYTRRWVICVIKGVKTVVTEINCAVSILSTNFSAISKSEVDPPSLELPPKNIDLERPIIWRPPNRPKSVVSDKNKNSKNPRLKHNPKKQASVLNNIKELAKLDRKTKFEEIKQEDDSPKKKIKPRYLDFLNNLTFKEKPTILAYDSESLLSDPLHCKGVKSLALKIGHDYKFELCSKGPELIKTFKSFIMKSTVFHMIVIELDMIGMSGWKCVKKIRNFEAKYKPKLNSFIVALLNEEERDYEVYVRWGLDEFLRKPFNATLFEEIIKRRIQEIQSSAPKSEPPVLISSELDWFRGLLKPIIPEASLADFQSDPVLMLAIDDNYFILMGISNLRLPRKYKMEIAKSGKLGLEQYKKMLEKKTLFTIIFIDIDMPDMDGLETTRLLRDAEKEFGLKRNFICGLITDENNKFDVYHEQGMDEFLKKPVNAQVLNEMIDRRLKQIDQEKESMKKAAAALEKEVNQKEDKKEEEKNEKVEEPKKSRNLLDFEPVKPLKFREKPNFLCIDDNDFILLGISHLKIGMEYKMDIAKSGVLGLQKYKDFLRNSERFHAIFLDIEMPGLSGMEVAHEVRLIESEYKLDRTFICGLITEDNKDFDAYLEAGMNDFLKKPVNPKSMTLVVEKIMAQSVIPTHEKMGGSQEKPKLEKEELKMEIKDEELKVLKFKDEVTLLAVDDNDFILLGISHLKLDFKYKMEICKNGVLALQKVKAMRAQGFVFHAIFMDIEMPEMNGLECTKRIRELEGKESPNSYIFGLINEDYKEIEQYLDAGMNEFLNKPVNPKSMNLVMKKRLEDIQKLHAESLPEKLEEEKKALEPLKNSGPKPDFRCKEEITCLAVDDNDFILMGISHLRIEMKYKMEICKNGKVAMEKYQKMANEHCLYHMIFMDIEMPEMNGLECTKRIRELEKKNGIPKTQIIGLINDDYKDIERYLEVGMDEFINKPVNPQAFSALLKKKLNELAPKPELVLGRNLSKEAEVLKGDDKMKITDLNFQPKPLVLFPDITLLAVDDNDFILLGMSHLKLEVKYKMEIAKSGKKGFEKYEENINKGHLYHAIFIDIDMPEISGPQLTAMIREFEKKKSVSGSFIVGLITDENKDIERYLEAGMNEFLNKPVHPKAMNEILARRLAKIRESEEMNADEQFQMKKYPSHSQFTYNPELLTMLAVDDNDFILLGISHLRLKLKFKMETSKTGKDAFEKFRKMLDKSLIYHCIFVDIDMPVMNGIELTQKIREYEKTNNVKPESLICGLLTEDTTDIEKYKEAGMNDFLNKPVSPAVMNMFLEEKKLI